MLASTWFVTRNCFTAICMAVAFSMLLLTGCDSAMGPDEATSTAAPPGLQTIPAAEGGIHRGVEGSAQDLQSLTNQALATTSEPWPTLRSRLEPTAAIDLIHHVQLHTTGAQLSATPSFTTGLTLGPGIITSGQNAQLYPNDHMLFIVEISGADLRAYLEHSSQYYLPPDEPGGSPQINPEWPAYNFDMIAGVDYNLDLRNPVGERVTTLTYGYDRQPVNAEDVFTMAVNSYRALGGGAFPGMTDGAIVQRIERSVRVLIEEYLQDRGMIDPFEVQHSNWLLAPLPVARLHN